MTRTHGPAMGRRTVTGRKCVLVRGTGMAVIQLLLDLRLEVGDEIEVRVSQTSRFRGQAREPETIVLAHYFSGPLEQRVVLPPTHVGGTGWKVTARKLVGVSRELEFLCEVYRHSARGRKGMGPTNE